MSSHHKPTTYLTDACSVRESIWDLIPPGQPFRERATFFTGPELRGLRVFTRRGAPLAYAEQSAGFLLATGQSCAEAQILFCSEGNRLQVVAHSHPETGPSATLPSRIDRSFMRALNDGFRAQVIGMIAVRPDEANISYVRFFSSGFPFRVVITGAGVQRVEDTTHEHLFAVNTIL